MEKNSSKSSVFVAAAVAILVATVLVGGCSGKRNISEENITATVNGVKIYFGEVNEEYASLSPAQRESLSMADALSFVIEREILYQQAVKERLAATKEEQQAAYEDLLLESNITEKELALQLAARNSSVERLKAALRRQVLIDKLLDKAAKKSYIIKREEVEAVYNTSDFRSMGISLENSEKAIVDMLTAQRQRTDRAAYVQRLKDNAKVVIIAVPG